MSRVTSAWTQIVIGLLLSLLMVGGARMAITVCQASTKHAAKDAPPTDAEVKADIWKRQHQMMCDDLEHDAYLIQGDAMAKGHTVDEANAMAAFKSGELLTKCGYAPHVGKVVIKRTVGCYVDGGVGYVGDGPPPYRVVFFNGPKDKNYHLVLDTKDQDRFHPGTYYEVRSWNWENTPYESDHVLSVKVLAEGCEC